MLILPPDHQRPTRPLRRLSRRERRLVRFMAAATIAAVVAVVVSLATSNPSSGRGCVHAIFPGPVGAEQINQCGAGARSLCARLNSSTGFGPEALRTITGECRKAGLPVGA